MDQSCDMYITEPVRITDLRNDASDANVKRVKGTPTAEKLKANNFYWIHVSSPLPLFVPHICMISEPTLTLGLALGWLYG